jgi:hypothetical protein
MQIPRREVLFLKQEFFSGARKLFKGRKRKNRELGEWLGGIEVVRFLRGVFVTMQRNERQPGRAANRSRFAIS